MRRVGGIAAVAIALAACQPIPPPSPSSAPPPPHRHARPAPPTPPEPLVTAVGRDSPSFAAALRVAGVAPAGSVTLVAPGEAAWMRMTPATRDALLLPGNRGSLAALLRFHVVPGLVDPARLRSQAARGPVRLPTLAGEPLTATLSGPTLVLADATGHAARVVADRRATDGELLVVDGVLVPRALGPQP